MGAPLKETLPLMERIRNALPKVKQIWEHSILAKQGGDKAIDEIMRFYQGVNQALERGSITADLPFLRGDILLSPFGDEPLRCPT